MKCGLWFDYRNPPAWRRADSDIYREVLELSQLAEALGYDSVWLSEHHFVADGYCPALLPAAAAVAAVTERVRIGTNVLLLPLHHPLRVAEDAAVVDLISNGRFQLGVAAGYRSEEFATYGISRRERASRMEEGVRVLRGAWGPEPFAFAGQHWQFPPTDVTPKPKQDPLPLWMGASTGPALRRAARHGCHLLLAGGRSHYDLYCQELAAHGLDRANFAVASSRVCYVGESDAQAWEDVKAHLLYQQKLYRAWFGEAGDIPVSGPLPDDPDQLPRHLHFIGGPDSVAEALARHFANLPVDLFIFWAGLPGLDPAKTRRSVERFAREVMPRFRHEA